ncbi:uncharacterized protein LTR77_005404 [Saxophila tyrrhenica]|uniref:Uncharacterized protein n=1 Tax=Saxophila tyrrhenica TaxID=1690608 RepID=A0AAV9P961_9PEZI|nr:hypothetical protein LTR77_005404 [Saxophila tyrrhenica]
MSAYDPSEVVPMPMPEQYHVGPRAPMSRPHGYSYTSMPAQWQPQRYQYQPLPQLYSQSTHAQQLPAYYASPAEYEDCEEYRPPLPPRHLNPINNQQPPSPQDSSRSSSSEGSSPSWRTSIEPDPLPPHSNPQTLTQSQSEAFADSQPISAVHIGKDDVRNHSTGLADFRITREAAKMPSFLSTKPLITVTKISTSKTIGTIRFHTLTSNRIDLNVNGHETSISHQGVFHNRWGFQATSTPNVDERWYWKKDRSTGGAMLGDTKWNGNLLARMKGDLLTFEKPRLSDDSYEEIIVSAVAMAEAARRQKRKSDVVDIASAIGEFTGSDGGSGGGDGGTGVEVADSLSEQSDNC